MREKRDIGRGREWGKRERERKRETGEGGERGKEGKERERGEPREREGERGCDVMCVCG